MTPDFAVEVVQRTLYLGALLAAPILVGGLVIGLLIGILQAATQVQESSLSFVPKLAVVVLITGMMAPWGIERLVTFTTQQMESLPLLARR